MKLQSYALQTLSYKNVYIIHKISCKNVRLTHTIYTYKCKCHFMKRFIYDTLLKWKESGNRKPVIIEGI